MEKKGELKFRLKFPKLMKTNVEKMSVFWPSIMFMKTNDLCHSFHYVDENKGESCLMRTQQQAACSQSSLLTLLGATVVRHGQDPEGSGQVGHATGRSTGVWRCESTLKQTCHHKDTEALRTAQKGYFLCASVSVL